MILAPVRADLVSVGGDHGKIYSQVTHLLSTGWISHRVSPFISHRCRMECGSAYCIFGVWLELPGRRIFWGGGFCLNYLFLD